MDFKEIDVFEGNGEIEVVASNILFMHPNDFGNGTIVHLVGGSHLNVTEPLDNIIALLAAGEKGGL